MNTRRNFILALLCVIPLLSSPAFGALAGTVQWDTRTGGSDSNSGGFDPSVSSPGTDFSQQNSAQVSYTDLVIGATTTQYTSVLHAVGNTLPGNTLLVTGGVGCTTGTFEILSNATITATVDRSLGTAASVCTAVLGGSFLTPGHCAATAGTAGQICWVQAGTYTITTAIPFNTLAEQTMWGYQTTHNDQGTKPLIQSNTSGINFISWGVSSALTLNNIKFATSGNTFNQFVIPAETGGQLDILNCILTGNAQTNTVGIDLFNSRATVYVVNTEINNWDTGIFASSGGGGNTLFMVFYDSFIHNNVTAGFGDGGNTAANTFITSIHTVWDSNGYGIRLSGSGIGGIAITSADSVFSNSTHDGINNASAHANNLNANAYINSIFYGNTAYGINAAGCFSGPFGTYGEPAITNGVGANGTANYNCVTGVGDIALSVSPFTSSSVFTLNSTAGGGAALKGVGTPGTTPSGVGHIDIGALQTAGASGCGTQTVTCAQ